MSRGGESKSGSTQGMVCIKYMFQSHRRGFLCATLFTLFYIVALNLSQSSDNKNNAVDKIDVTTRQGLVTQVNHATVLVRSGHEESNVLKHVNSQDLIQRPDFARHECSVKLKTLRPTQHNFIQSCASGNKETGTCLHFGTEYGGHELPFPLCWLKPGDVYYGFGCGEDISFDVSLADAYDLTVRLFDPTPKAIRHVDAVIRALDTRKIPMWHQEDRRDKYYHEGVKQEISGGVSASNWFEKIILSNVKSSQIDFHPWALANSDKNMNFFEPPSGVSHSLLPKHSGAMQLSVIARELSSIMTELKDEKVSVIKIDIEGYEIVLIPILMDLFRTWPTSHWPRILLFDMDSLRPEHGNSNIMEGHKCVQLICDAGYKLFSSRHHDYTFVLQA